MRDIAFGVLISVLLILLVALFCAVLIKLYIQKIKKYNQIIYQKEIDHQVQLNQMMLETQEQTFQHLSQELHDDAGQQLTYINFQLEHLKLDYPNLENNINLVSSSVLQLSTSIRQLSHSLNNQILSQQDLIKAIEIETNRINQYKNVHIQFQNNLSKNISFSTHEKIVIYRVFQEAINNVFKHAQATNVLVYVENQSKFLLKIQDNGTGFTVENELNTSKSNGLQNMMSRAAIIGFQIQILSAIGKGTTVELTQK
ncbi:sensor histidine kinase [Flavobacterium croceum]|uniref:histidine kinase n=1 Tax=Flavobacterium croceum DSM 17960 TaxID=1121886 RepID=A0A2S4N9S3_9FLAO|nr:ATP-binding protein [Flavobacterium croceum]POS02449.1 signal transduction histidine kinase [Flavobacterium croceum DSM 17960]